MRLLSIRHRQQHTFFLCQLEILIFGQRLKIELSNNFTKIKNYSIDNKKGSWPITYNLSSQQWNKLYVLFLVSRKMYAIKTNKKYYVLRNTMKPSICKLNYCRALNIFHPKMITFHLVWLLAICTIIKKKKETFYSNRIFSVRNCMYLFKQILCSTSTSECIDNCYTVSSMRIEVSIFFRFLLFFFVYKYNIKSTGDKVRHKRIGFFDY